MKALILVALLSLALSELALRISSLFVSFCRNFSQDPVVLQILRFNLDRLARIVLVVQALGEFVRQFSCHFSSLSKCNPFFFVQSGLPTTEAGSDLGVSGLVSPHHLRLRGPLVARYAGALRRLMRVFHAGRLESSLAGRGLDDPRRSLLCKFRGRSDRRYNRQTRALVVLVGATALPSAPGRTIFDLRPLLLGQMDPHGCRV